MKVKELEAAEDRSGSVSGRKAQKIRSERMTGPNPPLVGDLVMSRRRGVLVLVAALRPVSAMLLAQPQLRSLDN